MRALRVEGPWSRNWAPASGQPAVLRRGGVLDAAARRSLPFVCGVEVAPTLAHPKRRAAPMFVLRGARRPAGAVSYHTNVRVRSTLNLQQVRRVSTAHTQYLHESRISRTASTHRESARLHTNTVARSERVPAGRRLAPLRLLATRLRSVPAPVLEGRAVRLWRPANGQALGARVEVRRQWRGLLAGADGTPGRAGRDGVDASRGASLAFARREEATHSAAARARPRPQVRRALREVELHWAKPQGIDTKTIEREMHRLVEERTKRIAHAVEARPPVLDMNGICNQVQDALERRVRIERERRGL